CVSVSGEGKTVDSTVKLANNMILKCVCPKNGTISLITWSKKKDNGKDNIAVLQLPRNLHIESKYQNRVDIVKQTSNNKSLVFTNATEADIGYYHCSFTLFPQGIWEKRIHVVQSGDFEPHVLPAFHLAMKLERRANFTCQHDSEVAVNQVIWEKVQVDSVDLVVQCDESGTAIRGAEYEERVEIDCANRASSTMTLENVTASDFGIYRCHYIGANGENTTGWIKLENTTGWIINGTRPLDYDQAVFFIAGGTVTATILLIILLASVVAVHQQRKRKRKRAVTTKPFNVAQKQDSTRYGRPGFQVRQNANGERNAGTLATVQDPVYVNYRVGSHKTNEGV
ncbi:CD226 antigen, partial [Tiliqua scincoides]|uniref:CD226 antigen n=1 Tax=Tiliqua scincoides TaxID=71010 RepID=UPI0034630270